jgi:hypothetical protein
MCYMYHSQRLYLDWNEFGDGGVMALAKAAAGGAMAQLTRLDLENNQIGDEGMIKFSEACAGMAQLQARSLPTTVSASPETWHAHSPDPDVLFGVQYADACA